MLSNHAESQSARFLDTNILLRYLTRDNPDMAERAFALLQRIDEGQERAVTSPMVIFETVFTLQKFYGISREMIRDLVAPIVTLRGLNLPGKHVYLRALDLYTERNVSFADAFNVAYMESRGLIEIYTWDRHFDHFEGIERVEPLA